MFCAQLRTCRPLSENHRVHLDAGKHTYRQWQRLSRSNVQVLEKLLHQGCLLLVHLRLLLLPSPTLAPSATPPLIPNEASAGRQRCAHTIDASLSGSTHTLAWQLPLLPSPLPHDPVPQGTLTARIPSSRRPPLVLRRGQSRGDANVRKPLRLLQPAPPRRPLASPSCRAGGLLCGTKGAVTRAAQGPLPQRRLGEAPSVARDLPTERQGASHNRDAVASPDVPLRRAAGRALRCATALL